MIRFATLCSLVLLLATAAHAQTARTVLVEEATGTWCVYCPAGADTLKAILRDMGNVRGLAYHGGSTSEPMQTTEGNALLANFPTSGYPTAAVDRIVWNVNGNQSIMLSRTVWRQAVLTRLANAPTSPCTITLTGTYDSTTRTLNGTVEVMALQAIAGPHYINIVLSESDLNYQQWSPNGWLDPYYHKHVVRKMITGALGTQIVANGFAQNQIGVQNFNYTLPSGWNINKMEITVFLTKSYQGTYGNSREIPAAMQLPLRQALTFTPVELKLFRAEQQGVDVQLVWRTASETNNAGWHIERRTVESDWREIGFVPGAGTTRDGRDYTFIDPSPVGDRLYSYRLRQRDFDGTTSYSLNAPIFVRGAADGFVLMQNYPNPFNPSTTIEYRLDNEAPVRIEVLDMLGRVVAVLRDGMQQPGVHAEIWNAVDASGAVLPSGMYLCRMVTPGQTLTRTMHLTR